MAIRVPRFGQRSKGAVGSRRNRSVRGHKLRSRRP